MLSDLDEITLRKGASYVQEKSKEISENDLRHLTERFQCLGIPFNSERFEESLNIFDEGLYKKILISSLYKIFSLLLLSPSEDISWHYLVSKGQGLRGFSIEYKSHIDKLISFFGLENIYVCVKNQEDSIKYKFGCYKELSESSRTSIYSLKAKYNLSGELLNLDDLDQNNKDFFLLQNSLRKNIFLEESIIKRLQVKIEHRSNTSNYQRLNDIQILNMMALIERNSLEHLDFIRKLTLEKILQIDETILRNNLLGNYYYQSSQLSFEKNELDRAIIHLNKAIEHDPNYFDYFYKRGMIYETLGEHMKAKKNFQLGIEYSGFSFSIVNDLGCLLSDYFQNEFIEYERFIQNLNIYE